MNLSSAPERPTPRPKRMTMEWSTTGRGNAKRYVIPCSMLFFLAIHLIWSQFNFSIPIHLTGFFCFNICPDHIRYGLWEYEFTASIWVRQFLGFLRLHEEEKEESSTGHSRREEEQSSSERKHRDGGDLLVFQFDLMVLRRLNDYSEMPFNCLLEFMAIWLAIFVSGTISKFKTYDSLES